MKRDAKRMKKRMTLLEQQRILDHEERMKRLKQLEEEKISFDERLKILPEQVCSSP